LRFVYSLEEARVTLSIDTGEIKHPSGDGEQTVVIANANFNRKCSEDRPFEEAALCLEKGPSDWERYSKLLHDVFEEKQ